MVKLSIRYVKIYMYMIHMYVTYIYLLMMIYYINHFVGLLTGYNKPSVYRGEFVKVNAQQPNFQE